MMAKLVRCVILLSTAAALGVPALAESYDGFFQGTALIRTDTRNRVVIVLDTDRDGFTNDVMLFDPSDPIPGGIAPMVKDVRVRKIEHDLELDALDGSVVLRLHSSLPPEGRSSTTITGTTTTAYGPAIVHFKYDTDLTPHLLQRLAETDTDPFVSLAPEPPCGTTDADCTSGNRRADSCGGGCYGGGGSNAGVTIAGTGASGGQTRGAMPPCNVSCRVEPGSYACCYCDKGASSDSLYGTPICTCRSIGSLQPCPKEK